MNLRLGPSAEVYREYNAADVNAMIKFDRWPQVGRTLRSLRPHARMRVWTERCMNHPTRSHKKRIFSTDCVDQSLTAARIHLDARKPFRHCREIPERFRGGTVVRKV